MTRSEGIAFAGIGVTLFALWKSKPATIQIIAEPAQTQKWAGAGTDPFGHSYTVTGKIARGGL